MDRKMVNAPHRALANIVRTTCCNLQSFLSSLHLSAPRHPALCLPAEEVSIERSLNRSFHPTISHVDRQIIDTLSRRPVRSV